MKNINSIVVRTIPHRNQRYNTVGDWEIMGSTVWISVSDTGNWKYNMAVALHEIAEALMCISNGRKQEDIDNFDSAFENDRKKGNTDEPGDDPFAPYQREHGIATGFERILLVEMDANWMEYEKALHEL